MDLDPRSDEAHERVLEFTRIMLDELEKPLFEPVGDGPFPLDEWVRDRRTSSVFHLGGVPWLDAPIPRRFHHCKPQTRGLIRGFYVERCACGAVGSGRFWHERNTRKPGDTL